MGDCCYANQPVPAAAALATADADQSNSSTGAQAAAMAQESRSSAQTGAENEPTLTKPGKRTCKCWWVALAAVVVVAVVASR